MESTRQQKVAKLVQKDLSQVFIEEGSWIYGRVMVSITTVRISPDLSVAKIYLSIFGAQNKKEIINKLNEHKPRIRFLLGQRIKSQLRIVPELIFYIDDSAEYAEKINSVLNNLHISGENEKNK
jgi:ribosome-binding factor A